MEISRIYNEWLDSCALTRSPHTVHVYETMMNVFMTFLDEVKRVRPGDFDWRTCFSRKVIEDWLFWMQVEKRRTPVTCNSRLSSMRAFLFYLQSTNPKYRTVYLDVMNIKRRRCPRKRISSISKRAVRALLEAIDVHTEAGYRDLLLWELIYANGARLGEALSIKVGSIRQMDGRSYVTIIGKRSKVRTLYLPPKLAANIATYVRSVFGEEPDANAYLFFSRTKGIYVPVSQKAVEDRMRRLAARAHESCEEVPLDLHPHVLRHSCATHWLSDGMNILQVSKALGHENINTTMIYLDVTDDDKREALMKLEDERTRRLPKMWKKDDRIMSLFARARTSSVEEPPRVVLSPDRKGRKRRRF